MKIKIARIITRMDLGGAQRAVLHLSKELDPEKFEQIVITGEGGLLLSELPPVQHYVVPELVRHVGPALLWTDLKAISRVCRILRNFDPLIVHTHTPKAGIVGRWAAWLADVPRVVHTYHGFGFSAERRSWQRVFYMGAEKLTARITHQFVAVSYQNRLQAEECRMFPRGQCEVIRSGVDFSGFQTLSVDKIKKKMELGICSSDKVVGVVASFTPAKGLHHFLDAARKICDEIPDVCFLMVGDGALRPHLEQQIRQLQLGARVKMLGWRRDIPELLQLFDVFLLTSLWEGLPRSLVEARFCGVPSVASNVDGVSEVVHDGKSGYLVVPGDTETMAKRVSQLLRDESLRHRMGQFGKLGIEEFSAQKMLRDYSQLYKNITLGL